MQSEKKPTCDSGLLIRCYKGGTSIADHIFCEIRSRYDNQYIFRKLKLLKHDRYIWGFEMPVTIVRGSNKQPVSSDALALFFVVHGELNGQLYIGYPVIGTSERRCAIAAIWVTPGKGIVIFDLVEGLHIDGYEDRQDEAANLLEAKPRAHRELVHRRKLLIDIHSITYAPAVDQLPANDD